MRGNHATKSISFLMELIFVLFFFTIASVICVFVLQTAKEKNDTAIYTRHAVLYAENLIEQKEDKDILQFLQKNRFYLDKLGRPTNEEQIYEVQIKRTSIPTLANEESCSLRVFVNHKQITNLSFLCTKVGGEE